MLDDYRKDLKEELNIFEAAARGRIVHLLEGKTISGGSGFKASTVLSAADLENLSLENLLDIQPAEEEVSERLTQIAEYLSDKQKTSTISSLRKTQANSG